MKLTSDKNYKACNFDKVNSISMPWWSSRFSWYIVYQKNDGELLSEKCRDESKLLAWHTVKIIQLVLSYTSPTISGPSTFMAVPTRCKLPPIRIWSLDAWEMKSGNGRSSGENGGTRGSLPPNNHRTAWETQGNMVEYGPSSCPFCITRSQSVQSCDGFACAWNPAPLKAIQTRWFSIHHRSWLSRVTVKLLKSTI